MAPKKTYLDVCGDPSNDPSGTTKEWVRFARLTSILYDTTANTSKSKDVLLAEVMANVGPATKMNGGLIVFVEETDKLRGSIQVCHNNTENPRGDYRNVTFAYYNNNEDGAV